MKRQSLFSIFVPIATLAAASAALAETWESQILAPTAEFAPTSVGVGSFCAVLLDPYSDASSPRILATVSHTLRHAGLPTMFRLTPTDPEWSSLAGPPEEITTGLDVVSSCVRNPGDGLYAAGHEYTETVVRKQSTFSWRWKVTWSPDANEGASDPPWFSDTPPLSKNESRATGLAVDSEGGVAGTVYVSGVARADKGPGAYWVIRSKAPGVSSSWTTPLMEKNPNVNITPRLAYVPAFGPEQPAAVFCLGDINYRWAVRRSRDHGVSWPVVDTWPEGPSKSTAYGAAFDSRNGRVYVVGCRGVSGDARTAWVIRMSEDGGDSWSTLLDSGYGPVNQWTFAGSVVVDRDGAVSVAGVITDAAGQVPLVRVVRCTNPVLPADWQTSFTDNTLLSTGDGGFFPFGDTSYSHWPHLAVDGNGNLFTGAYIGAPNASDGYLGLARTARVPAE